MERLADGLLTPGLVDIQINGAVGVDFAEVTPDGMRVVTEWLPSTGVTRFLPTLITAPVPTASWPRRVPCWRPNRPPLGAVPLGVHLEGPFLSSVRHGVHNPALMVDPDPELVEEILDDPWSHHGCAWSRWPLSAPARWPRSSGWSAAGVLVSVGPHGRHGGADQGGRPTRAPGWSPTCSTRSAASATANRACRAPRSPTTGSPSA